MATFSAFSAPTEQNHAREGAFEQLRYTSLYLCKRVLSDLDPSPLAHLTDSAGGGKTRLSERPNELLAALCGDGDEKPSRGLRIHEERLGGPFERAALASVLQICSV